VGSGHLVKECALGGGKYLIGEQEKAANGEGSTVAEPQEDNGLLARGAEAQGSGGRAPGRTYRSGREINLGRGEITAWTLKPSGKEVHDRAERGVKRRTEERQLCKHIPDAHQSQGDYGMGNRRADSCRRRKSKDVVSGREGKGRWKRETNM